MNVKKMNTHTLTECAIMIALATVLSLIEIYKAPFGGAVTLLSMAPIIILSMRQGVKTGLAGAFVYSVMQLILGISNVAWVPSIGGKLLCILLDYTIAFTMLGFGGIFRRMKFLKNETANLLLTAFLGTFLVCLARFVCHIVSGAVIWYALDLEWYADDPTHIVHKYGAWMFSLVYNGTFMVPEIVETCIGVPILTKILSRFRLGRV